MTSSAGFTDPYLDPATGQLRNLVGARTESELAAAEGALTFVRAVELLERPPKATNDLAELQVIHKRLFQDVYEWAGQIRTVNMSKNIPGAQPFLEVSRIGMGSGYAAEELRKDNLLRVMTREQFIQRLSHHYEAVNYVHPFREGNGRTQRMFWSRIAGDAGWQLDWRRIQGAENDHASRVAAEQRDFGPL